MQCRHLHALLVAPALAGVLLAATAASAQGLAFSWRELPPLPANRADWSEAIPVKAPWWRQIGLAGPIVGVHGDRLLVGGGANFPEPGLTATRANTLGKVYWDEVFVMDLRAGTWLARRHRLPRALAYAATVSLPEGVLVIGGEGHDRPNGNARARPSHFAEVFLMRLDASGDTLEITPYPSLPHGMAYTAAAQVGRTVFVQGGSEVLALELDALAQGWQALPPGPGEARDYALAAGLGGRFVLASGRSKKDGAWRFHTDVQAWDPATRRWTSLPDMPHAAQAGLAFAVGDRDLVVIGGDRDLDRWNQFVEYETLRAQAGRDTPAWQQANTVITFLQDHHTGFNQDILVYDRRSGRWSEAGWLPGRAPATTQPVSWNGELLLVSGEVGPGIRTPRVWAGRPQRPSVECDDLYRLRRRRAKRTAIVVRPPLQAPPCPTSAAVPTA